MNVLLLTIVEVALLRVLVGGNFYSEISLCTSNHTIQPNICRLIAGANGRLKLTVEEYSPDVDCGPIKSIPKTSLIKPCQAAINAMPASKTENSFGRTRSSDVHVPLTIPNGKHPYIHRVRPES